ncbi:probable glucuronoxylan glucuronosyltransferase IRX7 [Henckelia pumila]|uniref:probable glucuronoxylan glucuronosyltransferase IRX7 n=1 Tax=Henckelia pumila TaxID=405737 RepID=UPI003C6E3306
MKDSENGKAIKSRGFYVRMKLLHTSRNTRNPEKSFCYRYFKWILWFSISFYFFSSFLASHGDPPTSISRTTVPISKASRALIEESSANSSSIAHINGVPGLLKEMKLYIYDLPASYNADWLSNERCGGHLFASEVAIHRALMSSEVRTLDPWEADFFFVPVYVSCNFSSVNGFPAIGHARSVMASAVRLLSSQFPFWNRSLGSDHVFVASHDFGSCFHTMESMAMAEGVPEFLKNSIILQTFGVTYKHPCQDVENVVIPPYVSPESVRATVSKSPVNGRRDIFVFFRGKMEVHPKNVSGHFYSKKVRTLIWRKYGNDRRFYLRRQRFAGYQSEIGRSTFCLCPLGWAPWSPRLVESVELGCVPVIIADGIRLPFSSAVPWSEISLTVAEYNIANLGKILEHVAATNLTAIQRNLWDPKIRDALLYRDPMVRDDATWQVLLSLSEKLDRSHKKSRVSSQ